ncbi:ATP-binding cassette domain-containing protein [Roseomonas sp. OT10]|uniref:ABC transporter ATP-binding protein n=1 Tax=Roseomonas cutis TaxID=2897332 RepID=UPI001E40D3C6|nr:ATP-binding cassette domain-containing protein [Roseomonas sp. OT10]UFN49275.1 ATP-binding cassette domain-containing protein [Roseomonas sp. OT10]
MSEIRLEGVQKRYAGGAVAVQGLDLTIAEGEFLTLLGPSGCGKTTTLRMIAGLETLSAGQIRFGAQRVDTLPPAKRNIAMVFQNYALYPHLTVRGNLEYPLRKRGVPTSERQAMIDRTARLLHIDELLDRRPRQLSGGQQQRVALGRAMIRDPAVFLFDEPLSNLDAQLRSVMRAELIRLHARLRRTMVYVTHDQLEAMTMSTRIAVMFKGELQQVGTPAEIYGRPANRFVAGFVGTPAMNFWDATLADGVLRGPALADIALPEARGGGPVLAGIRSEHIALGEGPDRGEVLVVEALGHETLVILSAGGTELTVRAPADLPLRPGEVVPFAVQPGRLHLFDRTTGLRL